MIPVGTNGLACIGEEDYAALALYMQCQAEAIDAALSARQSEIDLLNSRPTIIVGMLAPLLVPGSAPTTQSAFSTVLFNNSTFMGLRTGYSNPNVNIFNGNTITIGSAPGTVPVVPYLRGVYEVGVYAEGTSGVPAANAQANLRIIPVGPDELMMPPWTSLVVPTYLALEETTGGVVRLNGTITLVLDGVNGVQVGTRLFRSGASNITWGTVSYMWVRFLGPLENIEVS